MQCTHYLASLYASISIRTCIKFDKVGPKLNSVISNIYLKKQRYSNGIQKAYHPYEPHVFWSIFCLWSNYATKNKKTIRKNIKTKKILIISHLLEDMLFRYFNKAPCAPSTFVKVSSMFSSILQIKFLCQPTEISIGQYKNKNQETIHILAIKILINDIPKK